MNSKNKTQTIKSFGKQLEVYSPINQTIFENKSLRPRELLTDDFGTVETFNKYFQNPVSNLDLEVTNNLACQKPENGDEVLTAKIRESSKYQTILAKCNFSFSSKTMSPTNVEKEGKSLGINEDPIYLLYLLKI